MRLLKTKNNKMKNLSRLSFTILFLTLLSPVFGQEQIDFFRGTYQEAMAMSKAENKPIFVDAYAVWCGPCKWMDANTFKNAEVAAYYNSNFINLKLDAEKGNGAEFAGKYRVTAYPTLYFLRADGSVIKKVMGALPPDVFIGEGKAALDLFKN